MSEWAFSNSGPEKRELNRVYWMFCFMIGSLLFNSENF